MILKFRFICSTLILTLSLNQFAFAYSGAACAEAYQRRITELENHNIAKVTGICLSAASFCASATAFTVAGSSHSFYQGGVPSRTDGLPCSYTFENGTTTYQACSVDDTGWCRCQPPYALKDKENMAGFTIGGAFAGLGLVAATIGLVSYKFRSARAAKLSPVSNLLKDASIARETGTWGIFLQGFFSEVRPQLTREATDAQLFEVLWKGMEDSEEGLCKLNSDSVSPRPMSYPQLIDRVKNDWNNLSGWAVAVQE